MDLIQIEYKSLVTNQVHIDPRPKLFSEILLKCSSFFGLVLCFAPLEFHSTEKQWVKVFVRVQPVSGLIPTAAGNTRTSSERKVTGIYHWKYLTPKSTLMYLFWLFCSHAKMHQNITSNYSFAHYNEASLKFLTLGFLFIFDLGYINVEFDILYTQW